MKIKYEFVNGDVVEVEAPDVIGKFIEESLRAEHASDEKNRVHTCSLEGSLYEGREYGYNDTGCYQQQVRVDRNRLRLLLVVARRIR